MADQDLVKWYNTIKKQQQDTASEMNRLNAMKSVLEADIEHKKQEVKEKLGIAIEDLPSFVQNLQNRLAQLRYI